IMKVHIFMLIVVISAFSNVAFSAPFSNEKHSILAERQCPSCPCGVECCVDCADPICCG
ncbi:5341_t:CDS:1, partial [Funneliformis caledonium]